MERSRRDNLPGYAADIGINDEIYFGLYEDYEAAERTARELAPALSCPWHDNSNRSVGGHSILQGGARAMQLLEKKGIFNGWDGLDITCLGEEDSVVYSSSAFAGRCLANVVTGRNWVQLYVLRGERA